MVFVSMASDDLLTRTAQDQAYFSGSRRRRRYRRGLQPSQEYLNSYRSPLQSLHASASDPIAGFRVTTAYDDDFDASQLYQLNDLEQNNNNNNSSNDWEESPSFEEIERLHMGQLEDDCSESDESGSDSTSDWDVSTSQFDAFYRHNRTMQSRLRASRRHQQQQQQHQQRQREVMSNFVDPPASAPPPPPAAAGSAEIDTFAQQHNGLLKPHAQFYIERAQSMVNIKFDPPPYVLSSLAPFSQQCRTNDIQLWSLHPHQTLESA